MIEEFFLNLLDTSASIVPIVVMTIALAAVVGWVESSQKERVAARVRSKKEGKSDDRS